ncbi:hypothetical protein F2Q70_00042956 [Brassica cretica]|uniref:Uncharacterized protein n=1 Tax=Brassica cretica TaxID=69181 RepID=A0A8S9KID5_BRACR|nr:hypothetical protein F2Q70_00042956 [Brassica cretica]KAF3580146.1 hypothetical protein DY000_02032129 [Brassica cretica]
MYPIKARNGSVFEPNKAPSVGLTLGQSGIFGQRWSDPDKCCWIRTRRLKWSARQRLSEIRQGVKVQKGGKLALERFGARGGGYGLRVAFLYGKREERTREKTQRVKSPIKREFSIFSWIDQVRVKNDRLWGDSKIRRKPLKRCQKRPNQTEHIDSKTKFWLGPNSRFLPSTHLDHIMRLEPYWPARA